MDQPSLPAPRAAPGVLAAILVTLAGCSTPLQEVRDFGKATSSIAADGARGYGLLKDALAEYDISVVAADPEKPATPDVFRGDKDVQGIRQSATRHAALLLGLSEYGAALQKLAEATSRKDFEETSKRLDASLAGLQKTYERTSTAALKLSGYEARLLSTMVEQIGMLATNTTRESALQRIVTQTNPAIQQVTSRVAARFSDQIGPDIRKHLNTVEQHLEEDFNRNWKKKSYAERRRRLEVIRKQHTFNEGITPLFAELSKATKKMGEAHQALANALQRNAMTTAELSGSVEELAELAAAVRKHYEALGKDAAAPDAT